MKKIAKIAVGITLTAALAATAGTLAGCAGGASEKSGEAYALTHGTNRFIGYSKVTVSGDKVTDLILTEVNLPTQVKNADGKAYVVVTYGNVTINYDETDSKYKVGTQTIDEYFRSETNCKAYYDAAIAGNIQGATTADGAKETITKAVLSKEENGYWTRQDNDGKDYSRWKWNRDQTVAYVKANGVSGLSTLTKPETANGKDLLNADVTMWVDGNGVSTGATWSDLGSKPDANTFTSYAQLIVKAYNAAK